MRDVGGARSERVVDLVALLVANEHVDEAGGDRDRHRDGERRRERQAGAEAHVSRSA